MRLRLVTQTSLHHVPCGTNGLQDHDPSESINPSLSKWCKTEQNGQTKMDQTHQGNICEFGSNHHQLLSGTCIMQSNLQVSYLLFLRFLLCRRPFAHRVKEWRKISVWQGSVSCIAKSYEALRATGVCAKGWQAHAYASICKHANRTSWTLCSMWNPITLVGIEGIFEMTPMTP